MYSDAEDNFQDIATVCNVILRDKLRTPLEPEDIATIHAATKLCRIKTSPMHQDNWVDLAGYAVCGGGIAKKKNEEPVAVAPLLNRKPGGITFTRDWRGI